ncbi:MAG: hypothetical protein ATN34_05225 [Epulopiscium sp. Nele67-Bin002]|nr:MAG: hypothetical protein ATN34_05225 [Epulopiscium sp. Nele67-Bin002]
MLSPSLEKYLIEVHMSIQNGEEVTCSEIAKKLNVTTTKTIQGIQRLHYQKYLHYTTYQPIEMTERGEQLAKYIIPKYMLIDRFLDMLQLEDMQADRDAMAQLFSDDMLEHIEQFVLFVEQYPEIINRYQLYLNNRQSSRILATKPDEDR